MKKNACWEKTRIVEVDFRVRRRRRTHAGRNAHCSVDAAADLVFILGCAEDERMMAETRIVVFFIVGCDEEERTGVETRIVV